MIVSMIVPAHLAGLLCHHDPANIQLQLANRLPAACYVQHAASSSGSPPNVSHSLVYYDVNSLTPAIIRHLEDDLASRTHRPHTS